MSMIIMTVHKGGKRGFEGLAGVLETPRIWKSDDRAEDRRGKWHEATPAILAAYPEIERELTAALMTFEQRQAHAAKAEADAYAKGLRDHGLYAYDTAMAEAGIPSGATRATLAKDLAGTLNFGDMGQGKQFGKLTAGSKVAVEWLADNAGKHGYGPNRKRRAIVKIVD